jgi:adenine-specific DNA-methyltransferase
LLAKSYFAKIQVIAAPMKLKQLTVKQSLNKAYRLIKPERAAIEQFKGNFKTLLRHINPAESEENMKGHVMDFLKNTWYSPGYHIATKSRTDFVIHTGKDASHPAGVLFEAKKPSNHEMVTISDLNRKAMHEIILYYLRERIEHHNDNIKYLVITNIYEWFVFDAPEFEKLFYKSKSLINDYKAWAAKQKVSSNNDHFYNEIAKPFLAGMDDEIEFTYFDIREYEKPLKDSDKNNDNKLIPLFKILSPTHLLKLSFANDSNSLDKGFYNELLYIIGLEEVKEGSKKLIRRRQEGKRIDGSLLENTIVQLETENCLHKVSDSQSYGETESDQLFSIALELCITWVNRVLFLKLLEAQLLKYHKGNEDYRFLNYKTIPQYDELYKLFFQVLARKQQDRIEKVKAKYKHIPYLNSSLFDITQLEDQTIRINMLDDAAEMPLLNTTVLKDGKNKPVAQSLNTLQYLFDFLNAYDFASEGSEEIQEERKTLINAAVLGLIFEKINGYKDGSIYTPGFITMYMCRQAIRQSVVNKFKEKHNWKAETFEDLHNYVTEDRSAKAIKEYNALINSLTICDPAVGSGHFLVSALNELIAVKSELGILADANGKRLTDHIATVENDELIVTDKERNFFTYYVNDSNDRITIPNAEVQRVQETLFHEKQSLIENSLFGVDINPKSVQICRLRLWIELLKNAYYIADGSNSNGELQTLPNIDINIKTGNSLVSRFGLDENLKAATPYFEKKILEYKKWVVDYKHEADKEKKRGIQQLMTDLKKGFLSKITDRNPVKIKLNKITQEFLNKYVNNKLFEHNLTSAQKKDKQKLEADIEKLNKDLEAYVKSPVYNNAFEWRFEFPEVLDDEGNFIGFDVIIGNPPYIPLEAFNETIRDFFRKQYRYFERKFETSVLFIVLGLDLLKKNGKLAYIAPITWQTGDNYGKFRKYLIEKKDIATIINLPFNTFEDAYVETALYFIGNGNSASYNIYNFAKKAIHDLSSLPFVTVPKTLIQQPNYKLVLDLNTNSLLSKFNTDGFVTLGSITKSTQGLSGSSFKETNKQTCYAFPFLSKGNVYNYNLAKEVVFDTDMEDKQNLIQFYSAEPKLLIRRIINRQDRLSVGYCEEKLVFKKDINPFIPLNPNEYSAKYLLAILASKFISYLYIKSSSIATKDDFRQTTLTELRALPIPAISKDQQIKVVGLVDAVLSNGIINSADIINEIEQFVYKLYNLSPEEIAIVEQAAIK